MWHLPNNNTLPRFNSIMEDGKAKKNAKWRDKPKINVLNMCNIENFFHFLELRQWYYMHAFKFIFIFTNKILKS